MISMATPKTTRTSRMAETIAMMRRILLMIYILSHKSGVLRERFGWLGKLNFDVFGVEVAVVATAGGGEFEDAVIWVVFATVFVDEVAERCPKFLAKLGGVEDFHFAPKHNAVEAFTEIEGGFGILFPELDAEGAVV